uniref:B-cell antigen receptor complex-associated protein alpha chain n=1 Tax=Strix occidentalis caurina TaxID=311401 RepID=A0A8D0KVD1_STROC
PMCRRVPRDTPVLPVNSTRAGTETGWGCRGGGVGPGPTSRTAAVGEALSLECRFRAPAGARATWYRVCPHRNCSRPHAPVEAGPGRQLGLYYCRVEAGRAAGQSCGTFLRVREPAAVPFLNIRESTKNRIITAEGVLLLLCAVGPGLLLLFRKRWANERLLQTKKSICEEENLYEGLNLDECSMYEDISRGLQPTYQDVGSLHAADAQLEKP